MWGYLRKNILSQRFHFRVDECYNNGLRYDILNFLIKKFNKIDLEVYELL